MVDDWRTVLPDGVQLYHSDIRPASLRLRDGSSFEYLVLIYDPRSERTVLLVEYSYG